MRINHNESNPTIQPSGANQRYSRRHAGQGIVEFALVFPILLLLILGIIALGHLFVSYILTISASREAVRYAAVAGMNESGTLMRYRDCTGIRANALRIGGFAGIEPEDVVVEYDNGPGTAVFAACPLGGTGPALSSGTRVLVTIDHQYSPLVPLVPIQPFAMHGESVRTVIVQIAVGTSNPLPTSAYGGHIHTPNLHAHAPHPPKPLPLRIRPIHCSQLHLHPRKPRRLPLQKRPRPH